MIWCIILAILVIFFFGFSYALYNIAFYNSRGKKNEPPFGGPEYDKYNDVLHALRDFSHGLTFEDVSIKSYDGLTLCGYLVLNDPKKPFHIAFHGYKANGHSNFCGPLKIACDRGDNILAVDQRACGHSDGHTITFGINESRDAVAWAKYVAERFGPDTAIYLEGVSMGGATVLMSADRGLPENVKGIFADCPFSSALDIIKSVIAQTVKCPGLVMPFVKAGARIYGGFSLTETTAEKAVSNSSIPVSIIHGTADSFVPMEMSKEVYEKNKHKVTYTEIDGAPHAISFVVDTEKYTKAFLDFIEKTEN